MRRALPLIVCPARDRGPGRVGSAPRGLTPGGRARRDHDLHHPVTAQPATVNYVHDGDTLFLDIATQTNLKVLLLAVDAPEVGDNAECYGDEACLLRTLPPGRIFEDEVEVAEVASQVAGAGMWGGW